ncbi:MAG: trypsin-like serine protease [Geminicoccaceae bacterium]
MVLAWLALMVAPWSAGAREPLDSAAWPWTAIGRVNVAGRAYCTGALVGPATVLTAAHCLVRKVDGSFVAPDQVHFVAGYRRGEWLAHAVAMDVVHGDPKTGPAGDWALLELRDALKIEPLKVDENPPSVGSALLRAAYDRDRPHLLSVDRDCRLTGVSGAVLLHDCAGLPGSSGAPLLRETPDGPVVVGIVEGTAKVDGAVTGIAVGVAAFAEVLAQLSGKAR